MSYEKLGVIFLGQIILLHIVFSICIESIPLCGSQHYISNAISL